MARKAYALRASHEFLSAFFVFAAPKFASLKELSYICSMATVAVSEDVTLSLPNTDISFLRTLSKKMGWTMRRHRKTGIEKGLEDIRKGNVFHAKNSEDLIKQILG